MKSAVVVDYGAGNFGSISRFLRKFGMGVELSNVPEKISAADLLVLPGVGSFGPAKANLDKVGASQAIIDRSLAGRPTLGICLGFQLMTRSSEEAAGVSGLNLFEAKTQRLSGGPAIGWRETTGDNNRKSAETYYFNHAFGVFGSPDLDTASFAGDDSYLAFARKGNLVGAQFHPEKSQRTGLVFLAGLISDWRQASL
jgi:glutamine amidotransferase